ncbi:MAG TPA: hypothetical protein VGF14_08285 [Alphaproteobacteria bacterium]
MHTQQTLVMAAFKAIYALKNNLGDIVIFPIVKLPKSDKAILPSSEITQITPGSKTKPIQLQRRRPIGQTGKKTVGKKTVSQFIKATRETGTTKSSSVFYGSRVIKLTK